MNSGTLTERKPAGDTGFHAFHLFVLLSLVGATVGVIVSRQTHPAALLLVSGAIIAAGLVGFAVHQAIAAFLGEEPARRPLDDRAREGLEEFAELLFIRDSDCEVQRRISLPRDFHNLGAKIDALPFPGRDGSQMIAGAATNRQHLLIWLNQKPKKPAKESIIISIALYPALAAGSDRYQVLTRALTSLIQRRWSPSFLLRFALVY
jgi:hypothetical protein